MAEMGRESLHALQEILLLLELRIHNVSYLESEFQSG